MFQLHPYQKELVNQAREKLADGHKSVLLVSPAGSGKSVIIAEIARLAVERGGHVMFMVHRQELVNQIVQTFQADEIDLQATTIMTVGKIANRLNRLPRPSLIITDESHHSLAKTYRKIYGFYADVPRLGFSASPWRMNGQGLGNVYEAMVEGPSVKWLIDHQYLAPYDYYAPTLIDVQKLQTSSTGDYTNKSMDAAVPKAIFGDVVSHYQHLAGGRQAIVYAHSIEASKQVVEAFQSVGITAVHADAKTPKGQRDRIMADFKAGKITILSNVDLISEGFNVPDVGVIIMLRPTASLVLDIQQSMRGMRYKPGKRSIIIDHVANAYRFGLPDTEHEWTLNDRPKKKKRDNTGPPIKTCDACYAVIPVQCKICPICGHELEAESTGMDVDEAAKLKKLTAKDFKFVVHHPNRMQPSEAKSLKDLQEIARVRGYKPGWAYYQAKNRGFIADRKRRKQA